MALTFDQFKRNLAESLQTTPRRITFEELDRLITLRTGMKSTRDMLDSHSHFYNWAKAKGYKGKDPDGKDLGSSQIWFAEYRADPAGEAMCPPYLDLWHWLLDKFDEKPWIETTGPSYRYKDITLTVENISGWARIVLEPVLAEMGGAIEMRMEA